MLPKHEFTKIFTCRKQDRALIAALLKNILIIDTGREFRDKPNIVPIGPETVNNLLVDAFVRDNVHPATFSTG